MVAFTPFIIISLALLCYSIGVWSERISGRLQPWHAACFWAGLVFDSWGTGLMIDLAGGLTSDLHGLTGVTAILLMLVHAVWATAVLLRGDEKWITVFHRFSLGVWLAWLVPYFSPMLLGMSG